MRRLALLACLAAVVGSSGSAAGAGPLLPPSVANRLPWVERDLRPGPVATPANGARARVIVTLEDPPLAAAAHARQLAGLGPRRS